MYISFENTFKIKSFEAIVVVYVARTLSTGEEKHSYPRIYRTDQKILQCQLQGLSRPARISGSRKHVHLTLGGGRGQAKFAKLGKAGDRDQGCSGYGYGTGLGGGGRLRLRSKGRLRVVTAAAENFARGDQGKFEKFWPVYGQGVGYGP